CGNRTDNCGQAVNKTVHGLQYVLLPLLTSDSQGPKSSENEVADNVGKKREAANTNSTNKLNTVSSPVNAVNSSFTTVDPRRERAQRNEFESMFGQDKYANGNKIFNHIGRLIPVNAATLSNADLPTDPLMPDLEDTTYLPDTGIFSGAYDDEVNGAVADF
nr:hypothetical protein [Tanacetum cinerariifolium]